MKKNLFKAFWHLFKGYWKSEEKWKACGLLSIVIILNFASVYLLVQLNTWYNEFYNSLQNYEEDMFLPLIGKFTLLAFIYIVIAVYAIYLRQKLQIKWRIWLTDNYLSSWLNNQVYYRLQTKDGATDNPDQRISEDIGQFVGLTLQLVIGFLKQITTLVAFGFVLWELSGEFSFNLGGTEFVIYGYMFWFSFIYSGVGTFLAHIVGRKLIGLNFDQQKYEADFRFSMMRVRENAESIAFYRGEMSEMEGFKEKFSYVIKNFLQLIKKTKHLNFYVVGYSQLAVIVPIVLAAPKYFNGTIQLGGLMQTISAFGRVQDALSYFVDSYDTIANLASVVNRLAGFTEHVEEAVQVKDGVLRKETTDKKLSLDKVTVKLPDGKVLLSDLTFELPEGKRLLVTGESGCGKSTLLRTLAGIWFYSTGEISMPASAKALFLPQRPYLPLGSLRRALIYPLTLGGMDNDNVAFSVYTVMQRGSFGLPKFTDVPVYPKENFSDDKLCEVLNVVGLPHLASQLDVEDDWSRILSLGEQQRLAFARVLLNDPDYLFMDEATSALDEPREQEMYELLRKKIPNLAIVSVGHRSTLNQQHDIVLAISDQKYSIKNL